MLFEVSLAVFIIICFIFLNQFINKDNKSIKTTSDEKTNDINEQQRQNQNGNSKSATNGVLHKGDSNNKQKVSKVKKDSKHLFQHDWLLTTLKGHGSDILDFDFSPNGKYIISISDDRSLFLWQTKDLTSKEHKSVKGNVEFDHATKVRFSPDSKAFVASLSTANTLRIFRMSKKEDGSTTKFDAALDFEKASDSDILNIGISSSGRFIMTCHTDTTVIVYSIKGDVLHKIDSGHMYNYHGLVSPCGRFVATSGFTPDVKVWEVCFDRAGIFKEVKRAFELKGHTSGVYCFSFNADSTRAVTISKDGTWKFWNISVDYQHGQDPIQLNSGTYNHQGPSKVALSPDSRVFVVAYGSSVTFYNTLTGEQEEEIDNIHSEPICSLGFDAKSRYLLTIGDRHIHVLHNVPGHRASIADMEEKCRTAPTKAAKDRFNLQLNEARDQLNVAGILV